MFRLLSLLFIFVVVIHALSDNAILKRADGYLESSNKSNQFRAYNDYKNLYLNAVVSDDYDLQIKSLRGIVESGKKLHIDVSQYSDKLSKIKPKTSYKAPKSQQNQKFSKAKSIKVKSSHKLTSIKWEEEKLVLVFDKKLRDNQINYFTLYDSKNKRYRYIFDIHASMLSESNNLRKKGISRIKIAQHNINTLRLVIENNEKIKVRFYKKDNKITISINSLTKKSTVKETTKEKVTYPKRVDRNKIIVIDAGHGGKDPGAIGYKKYREKVVVYKISQELKKILNSRGYTVYMTRNADKFIKLSERTEFANKKKADIFISIHANAVESKKAKVAQGIESYFLSPSRSERAELIAEKENSADLGDMNKYGKDTFLNLLNSHKIVASNKLAIDIQRGMLGVLNKNYKVKDGGVREGPFWVLVGAQMPAVLVEVGFITNPQEARRLVNSKYRKQLALGLANGIERYFEKN